MDRTLVRLALRSKVPARGLAVKGWVRTRRDLKGVTFLELNDGSCLGNLQVLVEHGSGPASALGDAGTGAAVSVFGDLVDSPGKGQKWELRARDLEVLGPADQGSYPLQKKRHSDEFLRGIAHLRPRTNKYGALLRIRSELSLLIHDFFRERGFFYVHTPIITGSDCEGAGELFRVTSLDLAGPILDHEADFFGRPAYLTVSGQLEAELLAMSLGRVYTFGPTFRAENSNTPRHAAEFWMVEPEMAFADLEEDIDLAEELVKALAVGVMDRCPEDLELFARFVEPGLMARLEAVAGEPFARLPYAEAVLVLERSGAEFEYPVGFGLDLQTEHERYLCETVFKRPLAVFDYPKEIKPFYMRLNSDQRTVAAMDVLVPGVGELIGGSQREERLEVLESRFADQGLDAGRYWWYLDTRRFGSAPHAGFGLGFERLLMLVTGISNIRDVIAFPRTPRNLEF
ncbi:MAG: asparagine--tRNA ligase [Desulfovibrionaceae bacterium]|nr:asparagine--tRNA ligase [Desulfovibrionaceae bacterium]